MGLKNFFDSIAFRISISIALVIAASTIAVGWLILTEERKTLEIELKSKGRYLAEIISQQMIEPLLYEERHKIFSMLQASMRDKESIIAYAEVYNKDGEAIITVYKGDKYRRMIPPQSIEEIIDHREIDTPLIFHINVPLNASTFKIMGFLGLGITKEFLYSTLRSVKRKFYLLATVVTLVGIMLGLWMARKILRPIIILNEGVKRVGEGEVGVEVPVVGQGEIKELSLSFNRMSVKLKGLIDEIKSAQENLIKTEKLYAIGEFSAGIAHEIKNPLTPIKMLINTAKEKKKPLTEKDINVIEEEINRIDNIVKRFLAFTRPDNVEKTRVNVNDILREVITITRTKMDQSSIHLVEKYSLSLSDVTGNRDTLKQVFLNILLNAMQAMDGNGGTLTVETLAKNGNLQIVVRDTGMGISKKNLRKIFDPFFTTKKDGTGMGLTLTHNIINDHAGKIDIDSKLGVGTTVKVELPL